MTGLSVCCLTSHEPAMVARSLETFRGFADEIVVAVDSRVEPARLGVLADVADTLVRYEFVETPERARPWLTSLCRNETVLMLDGDEVPSAELLSVLPELVADDSVVQFRLGRRWCFPDAFHWLAERPWWPDYQVRLMRPGRSLDFDLQIHGAAQRELPARYVDEPIYHLACVISSFTERRQRARSYEAERPGLVAVGGGPMNDTLYMPEHFATLRPVAVPPEDADVLRAVLGSAENGLRPAPDAPLVSAEEISTFLPDDALRDQGYRADIRIVEHDRRSEPGNNTLMVVEVANTGTATIPRLDGPGVQVRVAARLVDPRDETPVGGWALMPIPCDIPPAEARLMEALIPIPNRPGSFTLEVDLVNERGRWFGCTTRADLLVASRWGRYAP